jgi:anthranilate synthase component 2
MLLMIDNYDSFTYNLVQYFSELGETVEVHRNDRITVSEIASRRPDRLVISPGPCSPDEAGISVAAIRELAGKLPILGVCLGHQAIGQHFGGTVQRGHLMHGKTSPVCHDGTGLFMDLPSPLTATRYHSLEVVDIPACLAINATSDDGAVMGFRHVELPVHSVQFHPESIATEHGHAMLANFLTLAGLPVAERQAA